MKKLLLILLVIACFTVSLSGCGKKKSVPKNGIQSAPPPEISLSDIKG